MIKSFRKSLRKKSGKERGQVLVIVALMLVLLVTLIGLAIDTGYLYVSYARLRRATDASALAAAGEFKKTTTSNFSAMLAAMQGAAQQQLDMNGVTDATTIKIESCDTAPTDPDLCPALRTPPEDPAKIIRVTVTENVRTYFLSVAGIPSVTINSVSHTQAASIDVVLALDTSESMTYRAPFGDPNRDPKYCNTLNSCEPFNTLKAAAISFADNLMFTPYDRMAVIDFNQRATLDQAMTTKVTDIESAINGLKVTEGLGRCPYSETELGQPPYNGILQLIPAPPPFADPGYTPYTTNPGGTCRLFDKYGTGASFQSMDCPMMYGPNPDPSLCGTTNIADAIHGAHNILVGNYGFPGYTGPTPSERDTSLWVLVLITDGSANAAFTDPPASQIICPSYTWSWAWANAGGHECNDGNGSVRHTLKSDPSYDADDAARDQFDSIALTPEQNGALIFTIGLQSDPLHALPAVAQSLLSYPSDSLANGGLDNGEFALATNATLLNGILLHIANNIATRISK
jgi:Flp pilus assembly protein TadG